MNAKWTVVAVYGDRGARDSAVRFCDALVQRFWPEKTFEIDWRQCDELKDSASAKSACCKAEQADILIIATGVTLEQHVATWLEMALANRGDREGILVGLSAPDRQQSPEAAATQQYLRKLAHQRGLDYLTTVPPSLPQNECAGHHLTPPNHAAAPAVVDQILLLFGLLLDRGLFLLFTDYRRNRLQFISGL